MEIFILHPKGRVSDVQRRQMTTVGDPNVHNIAIEGTFDDCQAIVKQLFADSAFRTRMKLAAVNSINWARILAQVPYYFYAARNMENVTFSVPTGNFGDIYAGYIARKMGLPIRKLVIASNANDILTRCFKTGEYRPAGVSPSLSPSMDIQISSNFERLLFDLYGRDAKALAALMESLQKTGSMRLSESALRQLHEIFAAECVDDAQTLETITEMYRTARIQIDPHTAVGVAAGRRVERPSGTPLITLATAHPAKFPEAAHKATGLSCPLPEPLRHILGGQEHYIVLPNDAEMVKNHMQQYDVSGN
jgi:threonine synthase